MLTADMLTALVSANVGTIGTTLFEGLAPDTAATAVVLNQYPGDPPLRSGSIIRPSVQAVIRAEKYADAEALATATMDALDAIAETTLNGTRYLQVDARSSPGYMGQDAKQRHQFVVNFNKIRER